MPETCDRRWRHRERDLVELAESVVEDRQPAAHSSAVEYEVEVTVVVDVERGDAGVGDLPPPSAGRPVQGVRASVRPFLDSLFSVRRGDRRPGLARWRLATGSG